MPSPFPGMDPYLEDPVLWRGVHHRFITYMADTLNTLLPPRYVANIEERLLVTQPARDIWPDVLVKKSRRTRTGADRGKTVPARPVKANGVVDAPLLLTIEPVELAEAFIEIRTVSGVKRVVTVIEVLSPSNKTSGSPGREQYQTKQWEILRGRTHLLEIDLLREGLYTVAAPRLALGLRASWDYVICLQRGGHNQCAVWPVGVRQRLPRVSVPLADQDSDVALDLQTMLDHCYDAGKYERQVDYRHDPTVPLAKADAAWANALLRERGLRPARRPTRGRRGEA